MSREDVQELLRTRLRERDMNYTAASRAVGRNHAYIQQFLERGSPKELPEDVRETLAPLLGLHPDELRNTHPMQVDRGNRHKSATQQPKDALELPLTTKDLPVLGAVRGGKLGAGSFADNGELFGMVARPASLLGVSSAYAVFVVDDSMEPRYLAGEVAHVNPHKPCRPGCFVVVQTKNQDGERDYLIKRLVRRSGGKVRLAQYNPAKEFDVPAETVAAMHRIVGTAEEN